LLVGFQGRSQTLNLPPRPPGAPSGTQFTNIISYLSLTDRENWIYSQVMNGNVPDFLRTLVPVTVSGVVNGTNHTGLYYVTPDYLAIGTDADYFLEPMTPILAQRLCNRLGYTLPTRKMVNQIWTNAAVKLTPQPIAPSAEMIKVPVFAQHNAMVKSQRETNSFPLGALVSGDKKDVIISTKIYTNFSNTNITKPVVIYGWHYTSGDPIQPLYNGHEQTYADYSHGIRLVQNAMTVDGNPTTVTNVLTDPNLAALLSDEGTSEGTTNGLILIPRYTISGFAPALLTQPRSQTVRTGAVATLNALAVGDPPLAYCWRFNGTNIAGATNASFVISNAMVVDAGSYTMVVTNSSGSVTSRPAVLRVNTHAYPLLFLDDFESDTSSNWTLFWGSSNGLPDYTANWSFDYGNTPYTFNGVSALIPPAPNSLEGATRAVKLTVNNNDTNASIAAVNIYPKHQQFSGNFALKFDMWINYPGGASGINSTGSTEHASFGINHLGTQVNWAAPSASSSDGIWFAVDGEGGTSTDYRAYLGNLLGTEIDLTASGGSGLSASNNSAAIFQNLFPASRFETAGSPGKDWVEVELRQTNNIISWILDGTVIAQRANASSFTSGDIMVGFMDTFPSIANPARDAFVLFDNVRVEELADRVRFLSATLLPAGQAQLILSAVPAQTYAIEASTNLVDWEVILVLTASNGPLSFIDSEAGTLPWRFYRAK